MIATVNCFPIQQRNIYFSTFKLLKALHANHTGSKVAKKKKKLVPQSKSDKPIKMLHYHQPQTTTEAHIHKHGIE
jgi:dTDP-4-dehydrorhamnose 3,5-epimerase-like enzyme